MAQLLDLPSRSIQLAGSAPVEQLFHVAPAVAALTRWRTNVGQEPAIGPARDRARMHAEHLRRLRPGQHIRASDRANHDAGNGLSETDPSPATGHRLAQVMICPRLAASSACELAGGRLGVPGAASAVWFPSWASFYDPYRHVSSRISRERIVAGQIP